MDDLGTRVELPNHVSRIVSLVPSLTESVASVDPSALVAVTEWCTHPADLSSTRIRGTKNPDTAAIIALRPEIVLANKEENRLIDVNRLRSAGVPVWVTEIETVAQALISLRRLFTEALGWSAPQWLTDADAAWGAPVPERRRPTAIAVWREPWMVVGHSTFTGDLAERLGLENVFGASSSRYPHVSVEEILAAGPRLVVLPDEPYAFSAVDGPECFPQVETALVPGRLLTWYGPSLATARDELRNLLPNS
ncbi:substrate-binding family protein [Jatrophihabitans sp. GAS493]|uniref:helical backbone metal receptor n=1 Tax=Jatrophihabitans sp. GAS493 TaxID=1907575 RepID=UPI000BB93920|nr:helical backbone metal receptor [Jatrophihabitans sp. GAS493]SOD72009.1 substrate-binding family protein [Jatrophihabitans sp. GAS493]